MFQASKNDLEFLGAFLPWKRVKEIRILVKDKKFHLISDEERKIMRKHRKLKRGFQRALARKEYYKNFRAYVARQCLLVRQRLMKNETRLSENLLDLPEDTFCKCQLCGFESDDICAFRMWVECDDNDRFSENSPMFMVCRENEECQEKIDRAARSYNCLPWSRAGAGKFTLVCGDCSFRKGLTCTHPKLSENGGEGLTVGVDRELPWFHVSFSNGRGLSPQPPVVSCEGNPSED